MVAEPWNDVSRELGRWADLGLRTSFWIRDDDASEMTAALARLRGVAQQHDINIGLAVIPGKIQRSLLDALAASTRMFYPMCHGWMHADYGTPGKPEEFGSRRPFAALRSDATLAYRTFSDHFGKTDVIFVPPYNRIAAQLVQALPDIGFAAVSAWPGFHERAILRLDSRLPWMPAVKMRRHVSIPRLDVHVDVIDWKRGTARDAVSVAAQVVGQLRLRRRGYLPVNYPIGILTHHLVHDEPIWALCDDLLSFFKAQDTVDFVAAGSLLKIPYGSRSPAGSSVKTT